MVALFPIILSAVNSLLAYVFRSFIIKFFVFFALYFITSLFIPVLINLLPSTSALNGAFSGLNSNVAYFLDIMGFRAGISLILSAYATRFIIRRLPVIG